MHCRQLRLETLEPRHLLSFSAGWEEPGGVSNAGPADLYAAPGVVAAAASEPTNWEQYLLELINRGRRDPAAEAQRYGTALNDGLAAGTISTEPKQPLAFSPQLVTAARDHSQWLLDTNNFSHMGQGGSTPGDRMIAAGYQFLAPWSWAENIAWRSSSAITTPATAEIHAQLYRSPAHRQNQMNPNYREAGLGMAHGQFNAWSALMATENFARSGTSLFLTGVAYDDGRVLPDEFYTPGEGLGSVTITATRQSDGRAFSTQTWTSGGYSLPLAAGTYLVTASGPQLGGTPAPTTIVISTKNVKLDFTPAGNQVPVVNSVTAGPAMLIQPGDLTLSVAAADPDGRVVQVEFYRGQDRLGTDSDGDDGWSFRGSTAGWPLGQHTVTVRAQDDRSAWSEPAAVQFTLYAEHAAVDFGPVPALQTRQHSFNFHNPSAVPLVVGPPPAGPFSLQPASGAGDSWVIPPGATAEYHVTYGPTVVGSQTAYVALTGASAGTPAYIVRLAGRGLSIWQNPAERHDVTRDGRVTALDVLALINEINSGGARQLSAFDEPGLEGHFWDPDGDGYLAPADVLDVINHINGRELAYLLTISPASGEDSSGTPV